MDQKPICVVALPNQGTADLKKVCPLRRQSRKASDVHYVGDSLPLFTQRSVILPSQLRRRPKARLFCAQKTSKDLRIARSKHSEHSVAIWMEKPPLVAPFPSETPQLRGSTSPEQEQTSSAV